MKACKDCGVRAKAPGRSRCYPCYRINRLDVQRFDIEPTSMRILYIDIETTPNLAHVWGLWDQNVGLNQLMDSTEVLCFAYKWDGDDEVQFSRGKDMILTAWNLLNEADVVVHFYGSKFDVPHLNREFLLQGFGPPSPYKQVDLKIAAAKRFKFPSNKLQYISTTLGLGGKVNHEGHELWVKCMAGVEEAWATMQEYNEQDVALLEDLYHIMLPWLPDAPHAYLHGGEEGGCPRCGGDLGPNGYAYTKLSKFRQYTCHRCGSHFRDSKRMYGVDIQDSVL